MYAAIMQRWEADQVIPTIANLRCLMFVCFFPLSGVQERGTKSQIPSQSMLKGIVAGKQIGASQLMT